MSTLFENRDLIRSALLKLEAYEPNGQRLVSIIKSYYYDGLSWQETAHAMGMSRKQVGRDWGFASTWLFDFISSRGDADGP